MIHRTLAILVLATLHQEKPLALQKEIPLDGAAGFDCINVDAESQRLYVAHSAAIDVIDLKKGERVGSVEGVDGAHAAVAVPAFKCGFASAGRRNKLIVFDLVTLKATKEIETGESPDILLYVASAKELWCFNGRGASVTCVDVATLKVQATIKLDGKPEFGAEDAAKGRVYVSLEDKNAVAEIDVKKHESVATHALESGESPTGIALDAKDGLLLVACDKKLVAVSLATWKVAATAEIGAGCDGVVFDPATRTAFASCPAAVSVIGVKDATTLEARAPLEKGGKTCALDPKSHTVYVAAGVKRGEKGGPRVLIFAPR